MDASYKWDWNKLAAQNKTKIKNNKIALKVPFLRKIHLKVNESTGASGSFPTAYD